MNLPEKFAGSSLLATTTPFLDTDTGLEAVAFSELAYYQSLHFHTTGAKLASVTGGLRWDTLSPNRPVISKRFNIVPKVKRMNEFTYAGLLLHFPTQGAHEQNFSAGELAGAQNLVHVDWNIRYNEWNEDFNSRML